MTTFSRSAALAACLVFGLVACSSQDQTGEANAGSEGGPATRESPVSTTTEVPFDPSCREAVEFTVATIAAAAQETTVGIESFATEDDLGEVLFEFLFSLPDDIGVDSDTACGNAEKGIPELERALTRAVDDEREPVADLTLAIFAFGCSEDAPLAPDDDPAEVEIYLENICPFIDDYFGKRGFSLEGSSAANSGR